MPVTVDISTVFSCLMGNQVSTTVEALTVQEGLTRLVTDFPKMHRFLFRPNGSIRRGLVVFVNGDDMRCLQNLDTPLKDGDEIAIAIGCSGDSTAFINAIMNGDSIVTTDSITILIPTALRPKVGDKESVAIAGSSVRDVLGTLTSQYPELGKQLFKSGTSGGGGEVNRFINLYVNDEDIRFLENLDTPLKAGDELSIVPAIAGG